MGSDLLGAATPEQEGTAGEVGRVEGKDVDGQDDVQSDCRSDADQQDETADRGGHQHRVQRDRGAPIDLGEPLR